ncbi:MAG: hypothetical protein ABEK59_04005 [Halobacteria archaeon]
MKFPSLDFELDLQVVIGAVVSTFGGAGVVWLDQTPIFWVAMASVYGAVSAALMGERVTDPGRGFVWGIGFASFAVVVVTTSLNLAGISVGTDGFFGMYIRTILGIGAPTGLAIGFLQYLRTENRGSIHVLRAVTVGGVSGLVGGWIFGAWMAQNGIFPLIAGIVGSTSPQVGKLLHFVIAVTIGVTFALLFQKDLVNYGSSLVWGLGYGLFWWMLGGLTLFPLFLGNDPSWSVAAAHQRFGSLIGHAVYGILLGLLYMFLDNAWDTLFVGSDPLNRRSGGPGIRNLEMMKLGATSSLLGSLLFGVLLYETGKLVVVASLVGSSSKAVGFLVHLCVGAIVGMTYGLLFRYESPDLGSGIVWGLTYGYVWYIVGPLTLLPTLQGRPVTWGSTAVASTFPLLIGHFLYGGATGAVFYALEKKQLRWGRIDKRMVESEREKRRDKGSAAPGLWIFVFDTGVVAMAVLLKLGVSVLVH